MILCKPIVPQLKSFYTRRISFLASKEIRSSKSHLSVWIHEISKDSMHNEPQEKYAKRSLNQYEQMMHPRLGNRHTELAFIHLSTSSERPDPSSALGNVIKPYGGHIVLMLARQHGKQLRIVPDGHMSKGYDHLKPTLEEPKDAQIIGSAGQVKILKGQDYKRSGKFDKEEKVKRFLIGHAQPKEAIESGSKQYVVVFPVSVLGLTIDQIMRNIIRYKQDPIRGTIYDRMNDACTHAVVASMGATMFTRGLTTRGAVMEIAKLIKNTDKALYYSFIKNALEIKLSFEPEEVYNNRKAGEHEVNEFSIKPNRP